MNFSRRFIIVLDIGTTNMKCHLFSNSLEMVYDTNTKIELLGSENGYSEINPFVLWRNFIQLVDKCLLDNRISPYDIACIGLSTHRNTFITWDRETNIPYHNFIVWNDSRSIEEVNKLNNSFLFKTIKIVFHLLYKITGKERFLAASLLKFTTAQVTPRLLWMLKNNAALKSGIQRNAVMFGTLDTWLLYKLTGYKTYCTDISCASSTGMYDPFTSSWTTLVKLFGIPLTILPNVFDTAGYHFGRISTDLWGFEIPITCSISDQAAALYGSNCLEKGDVKITLGTGAFLGVNVGSTPIACEYGMYPLASWKYEDTKSYALEIGCHDCGLIINWLMGLGLCDDIKYLSSFAKLAPDLHGVYFIPTFSGLQKPCEGGVSSINSGFVGIKLNTKRDHLVRAVLEGLVFRLYEIVTIFRCEKKISMNSSIKVNGGVSKNNFICQALADICDTNVLRPFDSEASAKGVALLASQVVGFSKSSNMIDDAFETIYPDSLSTFNLRSKFKEWKKIRSHFSQWQ